MKLSKQIAVFFVILIIASLTVTSCDKNSTNTGIDAIYGTWNWLQTHMQLKLQGIVIMDSTETPGEGEYTHVTVNEDGTWHSEDYSDGTKETEDGTFVIKGDSVTFTIPEEESEWIVSGQGLF